MIRCPRISGCDVNQGREAPLVPWYLGPVRPHRSDHPAWLSRPAAWTATSCKGRQAGRRRLLVRRLFAPSPLATSPSKSLSAYRWRRPAAHLPFGFRTLSLVSPLLFTTDKTKRDTSERDTERERQKRKARGDPSRRLRVCYLGRIHSRPSEVRLPFAAFLVRRSHRDRRRRERAQHR